MTSNYQFQNSLEFAKELDKNDKLANFRGKFHIPKNEKGEESIYLCGNSLGLLPKSTRSYIEQELSDWEKFGVKGHFEAKNPWKYYHHFVKDSLAKIVGAKPIEVTAMNTLTSNLNSLLYTFYRPTADKFKIIAEGTAFPSDIYALKSMISNYGYNPNTDLILLYPRTGETSIRFEDIVKALDSPNVQMIMFGNVNYYSGQNFDLKNITLEAHKRNIIAGFDLAHGIGNIKLSLHEWDVDFACWCSYKYLNAGPGSIAGIFVHERYAERFDLPRLAGWWGQNEATRFLMSHEFEPMKGADGWQTSNPAVLTLASLKASLDIFDEAGIDNLIAKSKVLTSFTEFLVNSINTDKIEIITPKNESERGCQLSIRVKGADKRLFQALEAANVVSDWREPDVIRIAPVPLYNSFEDVYKFAKILESIL
jgi:kynureninase